MTAKRPSGGEPWEGEDHLHFLLSRHGFWVVLFSPQSSAVGPRTAMCWFDGLLAASFAFLCSYESLEERSI
ncbi:hypothetical protein E2C01_088402 [Portunus trituberculatus]|uniref:Uncharacterized protein n=1 Tax=Portunus trituberculatus TaxID=210409 RepID=A0A5B7JJR7_PORTR|nr:hypothetical protein [Portunus trituberculatus]